MGKKISEKSPEQKYAFLGKQSVGCIQVLQYEAAFVDALANL